MGQASWLYENQQAERRRPPAPLPDVLLPRQHPGIHSSIPERRIRLQSLERRAKEYSRILENRHHQTQQGAMEPHRLEHHQPPPDSWSSRGRIAAFPEEIPRRLIKLFTM